jgi:hypothetical protein
LGTSLGQETEIAGGVELCGVLGMAPGTWLWTISRIWMSRSSLPVSTELNRPHPVSTTMEARDRSRPT